MISQQLIYGSKLGRGFDFDTGWSPNVTMKRYGEYLPHKDNKNPWLFYRLPDPLQS